MLALIRPSALTLVSLQLCGACGSGGEHAPNAPVDVIAHDDGGVTGDGGADDGGIRLDCSQAEGLETCPCDTAGATISCGYVYRRSGAYVACSPGNAVCSNDLKWGPCTGDQIAHTVKPAEPSRADGG